MIGKYLKVSATESGSMFDTRLEVPLPTTLRILMGHFYDGIIGLQLPGSLRACLVPINVIIVETPNSGIVVK